MDWTDDAYCWPVFYFKCSVKYCSSGERMERKQWVTLCTLIEQTFSSYWAGTCWWSGTEIRNANSSSKPGVLHFRRVILSLGSDRDAQFCFRGLRLRNVLRNENVKKQENTPFHLNKRSIFAYCKIFSQVKFYCQCLTFHWSNKA